MDNPWLTAVIVVVPLLAGLGMIAALARTIYNHPDIPTGMAIVLGIAALLCVAPTILNLAIKLPGGTEISLVKDQLKDQAQQIKNDVGSQGADVRGQIVALAKRVEVLERGTAAVLPTAEKQQFDNNRAKTVVVLYADGRKESGNPNAGLPPAEGIQRQHCLYRFHRALGGKPATIGNRCVCLRRDGLDAS